MKRPGRFAIVLMLALAAMAAADQASADEIRLDALNIPVVVSSG